MEMELRKVQEIMRGDSFNIVIPKKMVTALSIDKGDYLKITFDEKEKRIIMEKY
jgi:bifunctional DNA-binding transcriptional regulator/antitoxin component of YhaV-PrlF toxin-antitoxin module